MQADGMAMREVEVGGRGGNASAMWTATAAEDPVLALPKGEQLVAIYLLTLSNLAFVPTICLAVYRRHFTLAAVFSYNCFFSTFYHACDVDSVYRKCIMPYSVLAFGDFFGSVASFFTVLVTMARVPEALRTFLLVVGLVTIATCEDRNRHNVLSQILPLVLAGVVMIISWIRQMYLRRRLFPSRRRYLCCLLPGFSLALTGIGVNYGLMWHKSTYQYTHSFWHVALMTCPCFLMPPRPRVPPPDEESSDREPLLSESSSKGGYGATEYSSTGQAPPAAQPRHQLREEEEEEEEEEEPLMYDGARNAGLHVQTRVVL